MRADIGEVCNPGLVWLVDLKLPIQTLEIFTTLKMNMHQEAKDQQNKPLKSYS